ncbi:MAG TPA: cysteine desulfurase [Clostridiales bacterium]|jgi:cysteine desulfurase|nr:cysteine desulfurase [Clostridiales bacterium]
MIYLDNSATTGLCAGAVEKMTEAMGCYGNPSSLHSMGLDAQRLLEAARGAVCDSLGIRPGSGYSLIFTGSGTESNNLAILGCAAAKQRRVSERIITTDSEHPSVLRPLSRLEEAGFTIVRLSTRGGVIDPFEYREALLRGAFMVTIMMVNNETGAVYDVGGMFELAKRLCPGVITHCDATQGYLKVAFTPRKIGADLVTLSAHKIHGPKGIGALSVSPDIRKRRALVPIILGGGQEEEFRSGTENLVGIAGFGGAAAEYAPRATEYTEKITALRDWAEAKLEALGGIRINRPRGVRAPHIISLTLPGIKSETMVNFLSSRGIAVSGGAACSSRHEKVSSALLAFGLERQEAACSLRISFSCKNTREDVNALCAALGEGLKSLVRAENN